jgi:magnesium chelatase family protein
MTNSPLWPGPGTGRAYGVAIVGTVGHVVEAGATLSNGAPAVCILGLPDAAAHETRDRIRAAILNSGQTLPSRTITVNLLPASLPKHGNGFDLAIAVAILTAVGAVTADASGRCVFIAELGLDGSLRPVCGVMPAVLAAATAGCTRAVVAAQNGAEAVMVPGIAVIPCQSLREVLARLRREPFPSQTDLPTAATAPPRAVAPPVISLAELAVPTPVRLALETSAAGGHHLCLTGGRGTAIPALASGLAKLLPPLSPDEAMEVTAVHSVAGLLASGHALITQPPYRAPHHTATRAAILGGGSGIIRPGEAALAHRGVLFLDDAPEFARDVLSALRQPLQEGQIVVARSGSTVRFPAKFILVAGMSPCPRGVRSDCSCSPLQARRYRARLTTELGSHIGVWLEVTRSGHNLAVSEQQNSDPDATSAARVAAARDRAHHRLTGTPWRVNADIPGAELRRSYQPTAEAIAPIARAVDLGEISPRAAYHVIRVAWTLADLAGAARPDAEECGQALAFQLGVTQMMRRIS